MCQSNHKPGMTLWFPLTLGSEGKEVRLHLTWHEGFGIKQDFVSVTVFSEAWLHLFWNNIKMTIFSQKLWHLPKSSALLSLFQLITHCSFPLTTNVFYRVITSCAPFIVKELIAVDEHSVKQIMATLCTVPIVLWKSLQNGKAMQLGRWWMGKCEQNGTDDDGVSALLIPFNSGVKTAIGLKPL